MATNTTRIVMLKIAELKEGDMEQIFSIEEKAHLVPWSLGILKNSQGENYCNLLLKDGENPIGFAICQKVLDEATLLNIAIDPAVQQHGNGTFLLNALLERLKKEGIVTVWLEVRVGNEKAIHLYKKLQFEDKGKRKNYYPLPDGGREDAWVMARDLTS